MVVTIQDTKDSQLRANPSKKYALLKAVLVFYVRYDTISHSIDVKVPEDKDIWARVETGMNQSFTIEFWDGIKYTGKGIQDLKEICRMFRVRHTHSLHPTIWEAEADDIYLNSDGSITHKEREQNWKQWKTERGLN